MKTGVVESNQKPEIKLEEDRRGYPQSYTSPQKRKDRKEKEIKK